MNRQIADRCLEIRPKLVDFAADRLGPTATGEVQAHLLSCQRCSDLFGEILLEEVESGAVPLLTPPRIPPFEWYDAYMRAGSTRFGVFWKSVRDGLQATDETIRKWASETRDEIAQAIDALVTPGASPTAVRTRGAVRVRGTAVRSGVRRGSAEAPSTIAAEVVSGGHSTGEVVRFDVSEPPRITPEGRFSFGLTTRDDEHDDDLVICTVGRSAANAVSFWGAITPVSGQSQREVRIEEAGVPGREQTIPLDRVSLAVIPSGRTRSQRAR
mgnify:CR=1 FL=1